MINEKLKQFRVASESDRSEHFKEEEEEEEESD